MQVNEFLELFVRELGLNKNLRSYYKLLENKNRFQWRKAYLEQRLAYVNDSLGLSPKCIWDAGCGYATTAIFASLNGHKVHGSTLEFYYEQIQPRLDYWSRFGDIRSLDIQYENLFDCKVEHGAFDVILCQDTLHHLEPIEKAVNIFSMAIKRGGSLVVSEENGNNIFIQTKNFMRRGFKRVGEKYDEKLQKKILFGNENARSLKTWTEIFKRQGFVVSGQTVQYIRMLPPFCFTGENIEKRIRQEQYIWKKNYLARELLFFGMNFTATTI